MAKNYFTFQNYKVHCKMSFVDVSIAKFFDIMHF